MTLGDLFVEYRSKTSPYLSRLKAAGGNESLVSTLFRVENNLSGCTFESAMKLARAIGVPTSEFARVTEFPENSIERPPKADAPAEPVDDRLPDPSEGSNVGGW